MHGSDAHENDNIFEPDEQKYCWIKADPTFNGLKQIFYEPEERVIISPTLPNYKAEYYVIDKVKFSDDDFQDMPIEFNENLTCIIGGKSTGKSMLLHNLANAIDPEQVKTKERKSSSTNKDIQNVSVIWKDGKKDEPRKIVYVPQTYLNRLSDSKESATEIDKIIEEIVWIDTEVKSAYNNMMQAINTYKEGLSVKIIELIGNHTEINSIKSAKKEIGNKENIKLQVDKLTSSKNALSKEIDLSKDELELYDNAVSEIDEITKQIKSLQEEKIFIENIDSLVVKKEFKYSFSENIWGLIESAMEESVKLADSIWTNNKQTIITNISNELIAKEMRRDELSEICSDLRPKIQENKMISEISKNIQKENEKLKALLTLDEKERILIEKENKYIEDLSLSIVQFKRIHNKYAKVVNEKPELRIDDLEFSVGVPFKKEAFLDKISKVFDNRSISFKETISTDDFTEDQYTQEFLKDIIYKILNDKLQPKKGNSMESAIRDICDDWFEVKYNVKMDNDTIDVMSPGKKALVLLKLLIDLADSRCPILIDQPEDDLDNRSVFKDLIPFIKKKKKDRQIIIVTHNANVVLGADAEEVIVANQNGSNSPNREFRFEYRSGAIENNMPIVSEKGEIELGILNSKGIQQHICDILEGGEQAFELRKNKYHI